MLYISRYGARQFRESLRMIHIHFVKHWMVLRRHVLVFVSTRLNGLKSTLCMLLTYTNIEYTRYHEYTKIRRRRSRKWSRETIGSRCTMCVLINSKGRSPIVAWRSYEIAVIRTWYRARREFSVKCSKILLIFEMSARNIDFYLSLYFLFRFSFFFYVRLNC